MRAAVAPVSVAPVSVALLLLLLSVTTLHAADADGFVPLFNGKDLSGWVPVNVAPSTFTVRDGMIVSTGVPTGVMRTERTYENVVIELEWKHVNPGGNAGLFVWGDALTAPGVPFSRGIEVQILDEAYFNEEQRKRGFATGHGDVFAIHGADMTPDRPHPGGWKRSLPSEHRARAAGEWNHYRAECIDGTIRLAVNGKVVSGGTKCNPRKGYLCLESEGGVVHYRNLRIKELPSTGPKPEEVARTDEGFRSMYTGVDLSGWRADDPGHKGHWTAKDWILDYDGKSEAKDKNLWTEKEYGDFQMIADWRFTRKPVNLPRPILLPSGDVAQENDGTIREQEVMDAGDSGIYLRGSAKSQINIWCWPSGSGEVWGYRTDPKMPPAVRAAATPKARADGRAERAGGDRGRGPAGRPAARPDRPPAPRRPDPVRQPVRPGVGRCRRRSQGCDTGRRGEGVAGPPGGVSAGRTADLFGMDSSAGGALQTGRGLDGRSPTCRNRARAAAGTPASPRSAAAPPRAGRWARNTWRPASPPPCGCGRTSRRARRRT
jgi:hypothetical protein